MSSAYGSAARFDHIRGPIYDQVPLGSLSREQDFPYPVGGGMPAISADPLPPPPLPYEPAVGPGFVPDEVEDQTDEAMDIKPVRRFIPDSVKNFFRGSSFRSSKANSFPLPPSSDTMNSTTHGVPCSPPHSRPPSPNAPSSYTDPYGGSGGSYASRKEHMALLGEPIESVSGQSARTAMTYSEKVEEYHMRYAVMKSWAGLLRILGCAELLLGAAVFACVCAYVHKDNEWYNMFGYNQAGFGASYGGAMGGMYGNYGYNYNGPKTPFILVVAGLAWIVTVIVLVLGMTMYYRTILLDSNWWPVTECVINIVLGVLYMSAAFVYVNDTLRGGLCYSLFFNNGPNAAFCRTEAGQTAAIVFLFITMLLYLVGAGVSLKMWRHERARLRREAMEQEGKTSLPLAMIGAGSSVSGPVFKSHAMAAPDGAEDMNVPPAAIEPEYLRGHIPAGHIPKPLVIADYVAKYPTIRTDEERDQYKAVFNDQYAEYKELHAEVQVLAKKFDEMDSLIKNLRSQPSSHTEQERIGQLVQEYQRKKNDPTFLEKKERCEYLKSKLSHIKLKIQEYDKVMDWNDGYS